MPIVARPSNTIFVGKYVISELVGDDAPNHRVGWRGVPRRECAETSFV